MKNFLIAVLLVAAAVLHAAESVRIDGVENSYRISRDLYRSAQPEPAGFTALEQLGVRSVLNLREFHKDTRKARHTKLLLMAYPVAAGEVTAADVENCLKLIDHAPKCIAFFGLRKKSQLNEGSARISRRVSAESPRSTRHEKGHQMPAGGLSCFRWVSVQLAD